MKKTYIHRWFHAGIAPVVATALVALASGSAAAATYVTGPLPSEFGGGFIPPDPNVLKNVQKATKEAAKLAASVEKCYAKGVANFSKGKATGVTTCLDDPSKGVLPKFQAKIAGIAAKAPGLPPCFDFPAAGAAVASLVKGFNPVNYCDGEPLACSQVVVTIQTTYSDPDAAGVTTFVTYPQAKANIPGAGSDPSVQERIINLTGIGDGLFSVGDSDTDVPTDLLDDRISAGLLSLNSAVPAGDFAEATFDCKPGQVPLPNEFGCTLDASDFDGNTIPGNCGVSVTYVP